MADYSDNTLRALIRQLIKEDNPNEAGSPKSYKSYRATPSAQMLNAVKALISLEGAAALLTVGLLYESKFTLGLMSFGLKQTETALNAVSEYNRVADEGGDTFDRMGAASAVIKDQTGQNKYAYLKSLKELKNENTSFTANIVYDILTDAKNTYGFNEADPDSVSHSDRAIVSAVLNEDIESVFDQSQFGYNSDNNLVIRDDLGSTVDMSNFNYEEAADNAANKDDATKNLWINRSIILELERSKEANDIGKSAKATMHMNNAIEIYESGSNLLKASGDELEKMTILGHLDEIEDGLENNFEKAIRKIGVAAEDKFTDLIHFTAKTAKNALTKPK